MSRRAGLTLIELALVLSLTGVLLAAFLPTFLRHLSTSKVAEAVERLDAMHRRAASYYAREHTTSSGPARACLPASAGPYPEAPSAQPVEVDFALDAAGAATWRALDQARGPLRYSYQVDVPEPGCALRRSGSVLVLRAHGDLDGDGAQSLLERSAHVEGGELIPQGALRIVNRTE